jgi:hypothetical protein
MMGRGPWAAPTPGTADVQHIYASDQTISKTAPRCARRGGATFGGLALFGQKQNMVFSSRGKKDTLLPGTDEPKTQRTRPQT